MDSNLTDNTLPLKSTQDWLGAWQDENKTTAKAFLIPASEIVDMFIEMGVVTKHETTKVMTINSTLDQGIRAYIGVDPLPTQRQKEQGYGNRLYMVGTKKVGDIHKDIVEGNKGIDPNIITGTGIYDFATPCPNNCDIESPLFKLT